MSTRTVVGTFIRPDGETQTGKITFIPSRDVRDASAGGGASMMLVPVSVELNTNGYFEIELPCTDDRDLSPESWQYVARVRLEGTRPYTFRFELPYDGGADVDITDLTILEYQP
jgi:hypothetical protein